MKFHDVLVQLCNTQELRSAAAICSAGWHCPNAFKVSQRAIEVLEVVDEYAYKFLGTGNFALLRLDLLTDVIELRLLCLFMHLSSANAACLLTLLRPS